jgi:hypothetical protein
MSGTLAVPGGVIPFSTPVLIAGGNDQFNTYVEVNPEDGSIDFIGYGSSGTGTWLSLTGRGLDLGSVGGVEYSLAATFWLDSEQLVAVPEPASAVLIGASLITIAAVRRRKGLIRI